MNGKHLQILIKLMHCNQDFSQNFLKNSEKAIDRDVQQQIVTISENVLARTLMYKVHAQANALVQSRLYIMKKVLRVFKELNFQIFANLFFINSYFFTLCTCKFAQGDPYK